MNDECIHGLGPVACCVICNGREQRERDEARRLAGIVQYSFPARFPGFVECGHFVELGDTLTKLGNDHLVCVECRP